LERMARIDRTTTVPSGLKKYAAFGQQLWLILLVSLQHSFATDVHESCNSLQGQLQGSHGTHAIVLSALDIHAALSTDMQISHADKLCP